MLSSISVRLVKPPIFSAYHGTPFKLPEKSSSCLNGTGLLHFTKICRCFCRIITENYSKIKNITQKEERDFCFSSCRVCEESQGFWLCWPNWSSNSTGSSFTWSSLVLYLTAYFKPLSSPFTYHLWQFHCASRQPWTTVDSLRTQ